MTAERIYAALLYLYPQSFRDEYGREMLAAFRDLHRDRTGTRWSFWIFVIGDILRTAGIERLDTMRWLAASLFGLLATVAAAYAVTWTYAYFYHPYFEGTAIPALPYGLALGLMLGAAVAFAQWMLFPAEQRRAGRWALASAVALPIAILFCSTAIERAIDGLNPVASQVRLPALNALVLSLGAARTWLDLGTQFTAMAVAALVVRALIASGRGTSQGKAHAH